jgi:hypothetical protein
LAGSTASSKIEDVVWQLRGQRFDSRREQNHSRAKFFAIAFLRSSRLTALFAAGEKACVTAGKSAYKARDRDGCNHRECPVEDRADIVSPPASMAKLMTFAVVQDRISALSLTTAGRSPLRIEDGWNAGLS